MSRFIPFDEFVPFAPDEAGAQIHINHLHCEAGVDVKRRLYIRRTDDGDMGIIAYCHHCSKSGYYTEAYSRAKAAQSENHDVTRRNQGTKPTNGRWVRLPQDSIGRIEEFHPAGRSWLKRHGLTDKEIKDNGILYSASANRVLLPVYDSRGLCLYQARRVLMGRDTGPKYLTYRNRAAVFHRVGDAATGSIPNRLVLCEDILSTIKCNRFSNGMGLLGVTLNRVGVRTIIKSGYNEFIVWLDNDNRQVKLAQIVLKNQLEMWGKVKIIHTEKDPKAHSDEELKLILQEDW